MFLFNETFRIFGTSMAVSVLVCVYVWCVRVCVCSVQFWSLLSTEFKEYIISNNPYVFIPMCEHLSAFKSL
jgi:hypothetical protein